MTHIEVVNAFIDELLEAPDFVMSAVKLRLSMTDYELVLKHADPLKIYEPSWKERQCVFPEMTGEAHHSKEREGGW